MTTVKCIVAVSFSLLMLLIVIGCMDNWGLFIATGLVGLVGLSFIIDILTEDDNDKEE